MLSQEGRIVIENYRKDGMSQTAIAKKLGVSCQRHLKMCHFRQLNLCHSL